MANPNMMNPMMNQNNGMMNPMDNNMMSQDMMNQMMIQNMMMNHMNIMNQNMISQANNGMMMPGPNFNDNMAMNQMGNNNMMMNQDNNNMMMNQDNNNKKSYIINNPNNANNLKIYFNRNEYIDSISKNIFSGNEDKTILIEKLLSIYSNLKKKLYRKPYLKEVILRESPKETLEYLLNRGVMVKYPCVELFYKKGIYGSKEIYLINEKSLTMKDPSISSVSFYVHLIGAGLPGFEFVKLEECSKAKVLKFSKTAPKWRYVCEDLNLFGKCAYNKCKAFKKEVIYKVGINTKFDFNKQKKK